MKKASLTGSSFFFGYKPVKYLIRESRNIMFPGSGSYWEHRYRKNGNSGIGSYGDIALYKAAIVNKFVEGKNIKKVIELGCGDGNQLKQFQFPRYIGFDVSPTAIEICKNIFNKDSTKNFFLYNEKTIAGAVSDFKPELALSLDVIYHLVEDSVYKKYMHQLFSAPTQYVIIYAWDVDLEKNYHVRHRKFTKWIDANITDFQLIETVSKSSFCDFFIYSKNTLSCK
jgi:SAM-dependent methyltransferase